MNIEKIREVLSNDELVKSLFAIETAEEAQAALKENNFELSETEIIYVCELIDKIKRGEITEEQLAAWQDQADNGELSEEALDQVSGGALLSIVAGTAAALSIAALGKLIKDMIDYQEDKKKNKKKKDNAGGIE